MVQDLSTFIKKNTVTFTIPLLLPSQQSKRDMGENGCCHECGKLFLGIFKCLGAQAASCPGGFRRCCFQRGGEARDCCSAHAWSGACKDCKELCASERYRSYRARKENSGHIVSEQPPQELKMTYGLPREGGPEATSQAGTERPSSREDIPGGTEPSTLGRSSTPPERNSSERNTVNSQNGTFPTNTASTSLAA